MKFKKDGKDKHEEIREKIKLITDKTFFIGIETLYGKVIKIEIDDTDLSMKIKTELQNFIETNYSDLVKQ